MTRTLRTKEEVTVYTVAILITIALLGLFGWWALSWSTHTLVWLSFMGLGLGSVGTRVKTK